MEKVSASVESARLFSTSESRWRLVLGVDFSSSNRCRASAACNGRTLHDLNDEAANPYLQALSIAAMLSICGREGERCHRPMHTYGFGDTRTTNRTVFAFAEDAEQPMGPVDIAARYRSIARSAQLGGLSSLAPLVRQAIGLQRTTGERHALLVLASGDLSWSAYASTAQAVAEAAEHRILVAVLCMGDRTFARIQQLCREQPSGIRCAEFSRVASRFPFGRLAAAEEIHRLLAAPALAAPSGGTVTGPSAKLPQCPVDLPSPLCPPDMLLSFALNSKRDSTPKSLWSVVAVMCTAVVICAALTRQGVPLFIFVAASMFAGYVFKPLSSLPFGLLPSAESIVGRPRQVAAALCVLSIAACNLHKKAQLTTAAR